MAIFLISTASRYCSPDYRMCDEIQLRYVVLSTPGRRDDLILDSKMKNRLLGSSFGMRLHWPVNLSWRSRSSGTRGAFTVSWYRLWFITWSLDCFIHSIIRKHVLAKMSSFSFNVSVSIKVSQRYSNIEMHAASNKPILKLSLSFGYLNI